MTKVEFLDKLKVIDFNDEKIKNIETIYGYKLNNVLRKIVSLSSEPLFLDDVRMLSYGEICNADEEYNVLFFEKKIMPVAECGDNDFVVFNFTDEAWYKFNIIDECMFKKKSKFDDII